MNDNNQMQKHNDEIEIDLRELWQELKKNFLLIAGVTATFVVAAAVYSFMVLKPSYQCTSLVRIPNNVGGTQLNTCIEILKSEASKPSTLSNLALVKGTYALKFTFAGANLETIQKDREVYVPNAVEKINTLLYEADKQRLTNEIVRTIKGEISNINRMVELDNLTAEEVNKKLDYLLNKVEKRELDYIFPEAELIAEANSAVNTIMPNKKKNIVLALVAGMFLSCGFVVTRYIFNKEA